MNINVITKWVQNFQLIMILVLLLVIVIMVAYLGMIRKVRKAKVKEEKNRTTKVKVKSSMELLEGKFDDIIESTIGGIIVKEKNKKYVALIRTSGSEYNSKDIEEKAARINAEKARIRTIHKPIMTWQYNKPIDMKEHVERYEAKINEITEKMFDKQAEYEELKSLMNNIPDEEFDSYYKEMKKRERELQILDFQRKGLDEKREYISRRSGHDDVVEPFIVYCIEWDYNSTEFSEDLTEEQIVHQAEKELENDCRSMMSSLAASGVFSQIMSKVEIISAIRSQTHPLTSDEYDIRKIVNSNNNVLVVNGENDEDFKEELEQIEKTEELFKENSLLNKKKQRFKQLSNQKVCYRVKCENCGKKINMLLEPKEYMQMIKYLEAPKGFIQEELDFLSAEYRELLLSGLCSECFYKAANEEEEQ